MTKGIVGDAQMHSRGNYRCQVCVEGVPGGVEVEVFWQIILGLYMGLGKNQKRLCFIAYLLIKDFTKVLSGYMRCIYDYNSNDAFNELLFFFTFRLGTSTVSMELPTSFVVGKD